MPELPEVETITQQLKKEVIGKKIKDVYLAVPKIIKNVSLNDFKKRVIGAKIQNVERKGKNIIFFLDNNYDLLIHLKLTGHLLIGNYQLKNNQLLPLTKDLKEPVNQYLHFGLKLDDGQWLVLSDLRKFAKVLILNHEELEEEIKDLGPDPLEKDFTLDYFADILKKQKKPIKKALMDQKIIRGIGNIYASEILFEAKVYPFKPANQLDFEEIKRTYQAIKKVLKEALKYEGTSAEDETYRTLYGKKGRFGEKLKVYQREGKKCYRCGHPIERIKLDNRSTFFCPFCQKQ